jgi:lycopene cyclase domain-containing protein
MRNYYYLIFNLLVILPVLVLSFTTNVKPHKHIKGLLAGYLFVSLPFAIWDVWAVSRGHWGFNPEYVLGPKLFGVPFEEFLFFITIPFALIYTWGVVKKFIGDIGVPAIMPLIAMGSISAFSIWSLIFYWDNGYTRTASIVALFTILLLLGTRLAYSLRFWTFQLILLGLFLIFNSVLTMLPIVTYDVNAIIGFKFGDIPIEDFLFNFAFANLFLLAYHTADQPRLSK